MNRKIVKLVVATGFISFLCSSGFAKNTESELAELKQRITVLEKRISKQEDISGQKIEIEGELAKIKEIFNGFTIGAGATYIVQGSGDVNNNNSDKSVTDASYSADLEIEKEFEDYGLAFFHFEAGNGEGITDELQLFSNVNADATGDASFDLIEAWYEHYFKSIPLTLTIGKLDAAVYLDANDYANDECVQFLGDMFKNSPVIDFPDDNSAGIRANLALSEFLDIELTAIDANADWEDIFENIFFAGQINFEPNLFNRSGNYRVYGWVNDKNHIKWSDSSKNQEDNYGFGLSFDQELNDVLGVFARYGWQNPEVYADGEDFSLEQSWSVGIQFSGSLWNREDDLFGLAFGQVIPSDDYKDAGTNLKADPESHLEAYYNFKVNDHLSISPDIQIIWDPYGGDATGGDSTILVGGIRSQVDF
jgi:high affinity Mn2+ porin